MTDCMIPTKRFQDAAYDWQREAFSRFDDERARIAHLVVHRRGRKTSLALNIAIRECCRKPKTVIRYIAPKRINAYDICWEDPNMLFSFMPDPLVMPWTANKSDMSVLFGNESLLKMHGADKIAEGKRGLGGAGFVVDEWSYHESDYVYNAVIQPIIRESGGWVWFLYTPNGMNHAYDMLTRAQEDVKAGRTDTYVKILRASESGLVKPDELAEAKRTMPHALYQQEYECEFLASSDMVLIQPYQIERLKDINHGHIGVRRIISCDPAFEGDSCVIMCIENTKVIEKQVLHPDRTGEIVAACLAMGSRFKTPNYIIDCIGNGKGAADGLADIAGTFVQYFNSSEKAGQGSQIQFVNRRAEAWWHTMTEIVEGRVTYIEDPEIRKQLCSLLYSVPGGRVLMELKSRVRSRLGRSPDDADCYVYGQWGLKNTEPIRGDGSRSARARFVPVGAGMGGMV